MAKIRGNNDGPGGRNETYRVGNRRNVPREQVVQEVLCGMHPEYHVATNANGHRYVKDNPDASKKDNVNQR